MGHTANLSPVMSMIPNLSSLNVSGDLQYFLENKTGTYDVQFECFTVTITIENAQDDRFMVKIKRKDTDREYSREYTKKVKRSEICSFYQTTLRDVLKDVQCQSPLLPWCDKKSKGTDNKDPCIGPCANQT